MPDKIRVLLVDDEKYILDSMTALLSEFPDFTVAGTATSKDEATEFLKSNPVDAAFLDIQMPDGNGFTLASYMKENYPEICTVFLTGYAGFALEGYDYEPVDFLVKPVDEVRFAQTLERIKTKISGKNPERKPVQIGVHTDEGFSMVSVEDILYLTTRGRKVVFVLKSGENLSSGMSMSELEAILTEYDFFRCHQSYLIPLSRLTSVSPDIGRSYRLTLRGVEESIPVSRRKHLELERYLSERITMI